MISDEQDNDSIESEYEALLSFMYLSPVGLVRTDSSGKIDMLNPMATQLLMPLVKSTGLENLFETLTSVAPELRNLVTSFRESCGSVCVNHRVHVSSAADGGIVLACTMVKVNNEVLITVLTDISCQVATERRLRQTDSWLDAIYTIVNDFAVLGLTNQGVINSWSPSAERLTGYTEYEAVGEKLGRFCNLSAFEVDVLDEQLTFAREEGWHSRDYLCQHKSGHNFFAQTMIAVLRDEDDEFSGYTVVFRDITERKVSSDNLADLLTKDHLTGAVNRAHFFNLAEKEFARANRYEHSISIIMLDADHFKHVNDSWGHPIGDEVLKSIVKIAEGVLRPGDTIARFGGEEFVVMLPKINSLEASVIAERLRSSIEASSVDAGGKEIKITVSIGCASMNESRSTLKQLLISADSALYHAKSKGRNRIVDIDDF
ncbi:sensor domain-containing diguanylate cyclase [Pseudomonas arsenicoxydans]|uniref:Sensor domain-containing diguanylate cyclase n=1 Tax=Pseudomonas arsenicoxydans TaxID=702115 RepID=A0A4P6GAI5_9PSED|nr:sensor domain-containing diguanylate cyclase [Pseudomonas arsenicoxydans]QAY86672.1 sensor domain-containing diguanylate cyclase [Pseudomonas arsenicoxydans]